MGSKTPPLRRSIWIGIGFAALTLAILYTGVVKHTSSEGNLMAGKHAIELYIGEKGDAFARRNPTIANVDRQPAGLNFYELQWSTHAMGAVVIKQGNLRLGIDNVISVTSTEDTDFSNEGISEIKINSALTNSQTISHDEARLKTLAYLQKINELGWKTT